MASLSAVSLPSLLPNGSNFPAWHDDMTRVIRTKYTETARAFAEKAHPDYEKDKDFTLDKKILKSEDDPEMHKALVTANNKRRETYTQQRAGATAFLAHSLPKEIRDVMKTQPDYLKAEVENDFLNMFNAIRATLVGDCATDLARQCLTTLLCGGEAGDNFDKLAAQTLAQYHDYKSFLERDSLDKDTDISITHAFLQSLGTPFQNFVFKHKGSMREADAESDSRVSPGWLIGVRSIGEKIPRDRIWLSGCARPGYRRV